ncbi:MAG: nuclear transport factor 2 family protein [Rhodospirillaceae bacterium]|nr:nuclear transport factor 2 family protein [Rhodospirillaceae bacterium]
MSDDVTPEIAPLIERYVSCSEGMNFAGKRALWDADDPAPLLMPEEAHAPLIGWAAIDAYWSKSRKIMESLKSRTANIRARRIAPDIAVATYDMRWIAVMAGPTDAPRRPISADVRVTALLRQKPEGWRLFHLMEGPVDLATMARLAGERSAAEKT